MSETHTSAPPGKLALYEKLVATNPKIERKGATMPYTSLNDHIAFSPRQAPWRCGSLPRSWKRF